MFWLDRSISSPLLCMLVCVACPSSNSQAQETEIQARSEFSGRQLFEHSWKPDDTTLREANTSQNSATQAGLHRVSVDGDGLGPLFNATSCSDCHKDGGGADVRHNVTLITVDPRSRVLSDKKNGGKQLLEVFPALLGPSGQLNFSTVVHNDSTRPNYSSIRDRLADYVPDGIDDKWGNPEQRTSAAIATQPVVAGRHQAVDFYLSQLNSPALYGVGSIDLISDVRIIAYAERQARTSNGEISGRFIGKFGWRGQVSSLGSFVTQACVGELGLTIGADKTPQTRNRREIVKGDLDGVDPFARQASTISQSQQRMMEAQFTVTQAGDPADFGYTNVGRDMSVQEVSKLTSFLRELPRPIEEPQPGHTHADVRSGEKFFASVGCGACHVADLRPVSGLFSDLLLHDMGPELQSPLATPLGKITNSIVIRSVVFQEHGPSASTTLQAYGSGGFNSRFPTAYPIDEPDNPQFPRGEVPDTDTVYWDTLQREWRTPPLWGVADSAPYLHDGRAETLEEAILWHGGEATTSRNRFYDLSIADKVQVLAFLSSLRAPKLTSPSEH